MFDGGMFYISGKPYECTKTHKVVKELASVPIVRIYEYDGTSEGLISVCTLVRIDRREKWGWDAVNDHMFRFGRGCDGMCPRNYALIVLRYNDELIVIVKNVISKTPVRVQDISNYDWSRLDAHANSIRCDLSKFERAMKRDGDSPPVYVYTALAAAAGCVFLLGWLVGRVVPIP